MNGVMNDEIKILLSPAIAIVLALCLTLAASQQRKNFRCEFFGQRGYADSKPGAVPA